MGVAAIPRANRAGLIGSALVHTGLLVALFVVAKGASGPAPIVYSVNLLAAPPQRVAPRRATEAATPTNTPEAVPTEEVPVTVPDEEPAPPEDINNRVDDKVPTKSDVEPLPDEAPSTGTDALTFQQDGVQFQDAEYLGGIVTEIRRRWVNPVPGSRLTATVNFTVEKDGSVSGVQLARSSGNFTFNAEAMGAIERSGLENAFGPLPEGFNGVSLPIAFTFKPENK